MKPEDEAALKLVEALNTTLQLPARTVLLLQQGVSALPRSIFIKMDQWGLIFIYRSWTVWSRTKATWPSFVGICTVLKWR